MRKHLASVSATVVGILLCGGAFAQDVGLSPTGGVGPVTPPPAPADDGVDARQKELVPAEFLPDGIASGTMTIYPALTLGASWTDNYNRTDTNTEDAWIFEVAPSVVALSNLPRHAFSLTAGVRAIHPVDHEDDRRFGANLGGSGRLDLSPDSTLSGQAYYTRTFEERGSPDLPGNASEPTTVQVVGGTTTYDHTFQRTGVTVGGFVNRFFFDDTDIVGGGTIPSGSRDRTEFGGDVRVSYAITPLYKGFVETRVSRREYDSTNTFGRDRSNTGVDGLVGVEADLGPRLQGEVAVGVGRRFYEDSASSDVTSLRSDASLTWAASPFTLVTGGVSVTTEETTLAGSSGSDTSSLFANIGHQVGPNTVLRGRGFYQRRDYNGINRTDDEVGGGIGVSYYVSRSVSVGADYGHLRRFSDVPGGDFSENRVTMRVTVAQ